jgi:transitional endoplasmic reticulum ATPase
VSFLADKKREHEAGAEQAVMARDYSRALFHAAKAAEFGLAIAEQSGGKIAQRYVQDAFELIGIAEQLKAKAGAGAPPRTHPLADELVAQRSSSATQWELKERPAEKLADVAGLEEVKQELREKVIEPFLRPELYERFKVKVGGGILMYGPPGNGKTYIARAIAGELDAAFFNVNASQIKDKYVGETEKNLQRLFEEANRHERAVLFFDEVDHLLAKRGNRKIGAVAQFLSLTDGIVKNSGCLLLLAATNKPWNLDEAVVRPGRLGTYIYVGPPDAAAREAIITLHLRGAPVASDVVVADIAAQTEGYSGADVAEMCDRAKRAALTRQLSTGLEESVSQDDFSTARAKVRPSVTPQTIGAFHDWRDSRSAPAGADSELD